MWLSRFTSNEFRKWRSDLLVNIKDDTKDYDTTRDILRKCDMFDDSNIEY